MDEVEFQQLYKSRLIAIWQRWFYHVHFVLGEAENATAQLMSFAG